MMIAYHPKFQALAEECAREIGVEEVTSSSKAAKLSGLLYLFAGGNPFSIYGAEAEMHNGVLNRIALCVEDKGWVYRI